MTLLIPTWVWDLGEAHGTLPGDHADSSSTSAMCLHAEPSLSTVNFIKEPILDLGGAGPLHSGAQNGTNLTGKQVPKGGSKADLRNTMQKILIQ